MKKLVGNVFKLGLAAVVAVSVAAGIAFVFQDAAENRKAAATKAT